MFNRPEGQLVIRSKLTRESLLDSAEFMELVRICIVSKCTYNESIKMIDKAGYKISSKTFQRAKIEIEQTRKQRISQIVDDLAEFAANTIDTASAVDYELWRIIKTTKSAWEKLKALEMIMKNCGSKSSNFDASPVLEKIAKRLENGKTKEIESRGTTGTNAATGDVKIEDVEKHDVEKDKGPDPI